MIQQILQKVKKSPYGQLASTYKSKLAIAKLAKEISAINVKPSSVLILGMHRSGTSCLTGMLNQYGLYLGSVSQSNRTNKKGNQEGEIVGINTELLDVNGASWFNPQKIEKIPSNLAARIEKYYLQMTINAYHLDKKCWGTKDPRMLFCLPAWTEKEKTFVGTIRHPAKVVSSLLARDSKFIKLKGDPWELWFRYNNELLSLYRTNQFPIVNFDWEARRYCNAVKNLAHYLGLEDNAEEFFEENLVNQTYAEDIQNSKYKNLYDALVEIAEIEEKKLNSYL